MLQGELRLCQVMYRLMLPISKCSNMSEAMSLASGPGEGDVRVADVSALSSDAPTCCMSNIPQIALSVVYEC